MTPLPPSLPPLLTFQERRGRNPLNHRSSLVLLLLDGGPEEGTEEVEGHLGGRKGGREGGSEGGREKNEYQC